MNKSLAIYHTFLVALLACSGPTTTSEDMADQDLRRPSMGDMRGRCELSGDFMAINRVSSGAVKVSPAAGIFTASVDATAGGITMASSQPYVYLDLIGGTRVQITDVQARDSRDWDIALKRYIIKINSGDSGPGGVTAAEVADKTLEQVTQAPDAGYLADHYFDENCMVAPDAIGGLPTVISDQISWFSYDMNTMRLTALKKTYVLKRRDGMGTIRLQIMDYYDMNGKNGGTYTLRWGFLQ